MHPSFICIGAQKAGTDWIYDQFAAHRDYWMPPIKEIAFFDNGFGPHRKGLAEKRLKWRMEKHGKAKEDYTHDISFLLRVIHGNAKPHTHNFAPYFALFEGKPGKTGDSTPGYCRLDAKMAEQMMLQMPDTKFLLLLRDPVSRVWSQAQMHTRLNRDPELVATASLNDFATFAMKTHVRNFSFLSETIKTWQSVDVNNRFKVFQFDDLIADADGYRRSIADFIGADPEGFNLPANFNKKAKQPGKGPMPEDMRVWAARYFEQEYHELERLVGGHAASWRERNDGILTAAGHSLRHAQVLTS